ncbi:cystathionine beta-lyase [Pseudomonas fluorescens]|uniref:Cystathionine beta-lyase MetC n=1 Tax=Pseudomonas fluorescens TaxID=294 RepID=A0A8H2NP25_PSEFL|nr:cystathionine beta-lyase [Pseudomonas fluorescens]VVO64859.1 Cystathionine beta-lyase MetC [Pseudomonas fluorescens]
MDKLKLHAETLLTHSGREHDQIGGTVNTPVYRASTLLFPSVSALQSVQGTLNTYGRHGSPTTRSLERALCDLEGAGGAMLTPSGLSAVTTALLANLSPGDHLLMTDSVYDPTRAFCNETLARFGIETTYYDPTIGAGIAELMQPNTKVVFLETPGSLTFEMQDVPAISEVAHAHHAIVIIDNTWGTPVNFASFKYGADISVHAATKYIVGHSDVLMGVIMTTEALYPKVRTFYKQLGVSVSGDDAYLALRGMRTLAARLDRHQSSAAAVMDWLKTQPEVDQILSPVLPGNQGHEIWKRDFTGSNGLFGVLLKPASDAAMSAMLDGLQIFGMGYSWGGFESLIIPANPSAIRTATSWKATGPLIRLHIGLENPKDLIADLNLAFGRLREANR